MQAQQRSAPIPAAQFAQYEGVTMANLIDEVKGLSLEGHDANGGAAVENGVGEAEYAEEEGDDGEEQEDGGEEEEEEAAEETVPATPPPPPAAAPAPPITGGDCVYGPCL